MNLHIYLILKYQQTFKFPVHIIKISFSYENIYVISRLIEGQFPDYNRVIPKEFKTHVNINKNEFQSALDRVSLISRSGDYNIIHFEFVDNIVRISSDNPNIGKAEENNKCGY